MLTGQTQSPGYWIGLRFQNSNSLDNVLQYVTIQYGGYSSGFVAADLFIDGTSRVSVSHCTIRDSGSLGFVFHDNPTITFDANTTTANHDGAGEVDPLLVGVLTTTSSYTGNSSEVLRVRSGHVTVDQAWSDLGVTYELADDLEVDKHLTISPGAQLAFAAGTWLNVSSTGSLTAAGTAGKPIVLTGQTQNPGSWIGLRFQNSNSLNNVLQYVTIQYGGFSSGFVAADLFIGGTSTVDMKNCTLKNSAGWGLWKEAASTLTEAGTAYASNASGDIH